MDRIAHILIIFILITSCNGGVLNKNNCDLPLDIVEDIASYAEVADRIVNYFTEGPYKGVTWKRLSDFVDKFGSRLSGTLNLENSIDYMLNASKGMDLENVHADECEVPHWERGDESATMLEPRVKNLPMLGLGYSIGTPPEGITAEAVVVQSFEELDALPDERIINKIVVYDQPFKSYGESGPYRGYGASEASKRGAIAALVRSVTPFSIATPHTGHQIYLENVTKIPVAAITHEDADMLWRQQQRGENVVIHLKMSATLDTKISRNMVADYKGSESPEKLLIISGHIDSWDVGDGSMDDAGGCFISWIAPVALQSMNLRPKRTIKTILFTAEEFGVIGAQAYEEQHKEDNDNIVFLMESDVGTFKPLGLFYDGSEIGECVMREVLKLFVSINATELLIEDPAPDISVWTSQGFPGVGLHNDNDRYFWFHHSQGDTLNVIDPDVLDLDAGFWTAVAYIMADMKYEIPKK